MLQLLDLYPDVLRYIWGFCQPVDRYKLKSTCKKFRNLFRQQPNSFYSQLPQLLIDASGPYQLRSVYDDIHPLLNENFILKLMIHLYPKTCLPNRWYLKYLNDRIRLNLYPANRSIYFSIVKLLSILDQHISYHNTLICIKMMKNLLASFKPIDKSEPTSMNEFFWFPSLYKFDFFFNKTYPNLTKILRSNF